MTEKKVFTSWRENYRHNYQTGDNLRVIPAKLKHDTGSTTGVAILNGSRVVVVITAEHAYKLANGIADALEGHSAA
jgi:hypothetical protein